MKMQTIILLLLLNIFFLSCNNRNERNTIESKIKISKNDSDSFTKLTYDEQLVQIKKFTTKDSVLSNDIDFINKILLKGKFKIDIWKYDSINKINHCYPIRYSKETLISFNEEFNKIGDLDCDKKDDFVCVLFPLGFCEEGQSYYFTNNKIPRLLTQSNCCHPKSMFNVFDIDEDGICEIGLYYSSCASRYKSLIVYSLKKNEWKEVGNCTFDLNYSNPDSDFKSYVRKTRKGKFQMLEITDLTKKEMVGKRNWINFEMK